MIALIKSPYPDYHQSDWLLGTLIAVQESTHSSSGGLPRSQEAVGARRKEQTRQGEQHTECHQSQVGNRGTQGWLRCPFFDL